MAIEMNVFVWIKKANKEVFIRLKDIFMDPDKESKYRNSSNNTPHMINTLYGTNIAYKEDVGESWKEEENWVPQDWWDENVGTRYIHSEIDYLDDDTGTDGEGAIILRTAHQVPQEFLNNLAKDLAKIKEDCYIIGTYECETYDPVGAFIYAGDYDTIEYNDSIEVCEIVEAIESDEDIEDENYEGEMVTYVDGYEWFIDSPNGREKLHDNQAELRDSLEEEYLEFLQDKIDNPDDYI